MKTRPILMSAPMVRAIHDGRKTQTRRMMKVQPPNATYELAMCVSTTGDRSREGKHHWIKRDGLHVVDSAQPYFVCPYGRTGDRLWVRETWMPGPVNDDFTVNGNGSGRPLYRADWGNVPEGSRWNSPISMPRLASRITLEITGVRVERLQDISEADANSEGLRVDLSKGLPAYSARQEFERLWESTNGPGSWDANPWVWVVEFKRIAQGGAE